MRAKWVTFTNLPTNKDQKWVQEAIVTGLSYYGNIHDVMVEGTDKAKCMHLKTIHVLLDMAPIARSRGISLPRFIRLPGCVDTITYIEPETERPVCRFCYQMGHTAYHCSHRKGAHNSEIDQDNENGVTHVKGKVFLRPKPKWWLPTDVTEILDMKAIQQKMQLRHAEHTTRIEGLTNKDETEDHTDSTSPAVVHIDEKPPMEDRTGHLDLSDWVKANTRPKQTKKEPKPR
ncbi:hypothetical protein DSO57_1016633 [Entomophthora muscae]|uniref:Uncharacterized protein n=1 Tax=Entomophthora muscae TaxID=34485 RepID=A0ACC2U2N0_9FUNG|nr:hypothetical protein DSO57_1016633 [Entomophthora muscae]